MRPLDLNLASRPFRNNTVLWLGHALLGAGVVGFTAWNTVTFLETGRTLAGERNTVGSIVNREEEIDLRERRAQSEIGRHDIKNLTIETSRANEVILRKAMSWTRLFNLLEKTQPYEVKMVSVRPMFGGAGRGGALPAIEGEAAIPVVVEGTARDLRSFLEFERALIQDSHFDRVEPDRTTHAKGSELLFNLTFVYYPEGQSGSEANDLAQAKKPEDEDVEAEGEPEEESRQTVEKTQPPEQAPPSAPRLEAQRAPEPKGKDAPEPSGNDAPVTLLGEPPLEPPVPLSSSSLDTKSADASADGQPAEPGRRQRVKQQPKPAPTGPIRKRPPGWQPPDPFAKQKEDAKKKSESEKQ